MCNNATLVPHLPYQHEQYLFSIQVSWSPPFEHVEKIYGCHNMQCLKAMQLLWASRDSTCPIEETHSSIRLPQLYDHSICATA